MAQELFRQPELIRPYEGEDLTRLYIRRAKYMEGSSFDALIKQERRKLQGLTAGAGAHINCEPIRSDHDKTFSRVTSKEIGEVSLLARITDHTEGLTTPAVYGIKVRTILSSTIDERTPSPAGSPTCAPTWAPTPERSAPGTPCT